MDILKHLNFLSTIDYIDQGGCGVATLALSRICKKENFDKPVIIALMYERDEEEIVHSTRRLIADGQLEYIETPTHVALAVNGYYVDPFGIVSTDKYPFALHITDSELVRVLNSGFWNSYFNREEAIPAIEYKTGVDLSDILIQYRKEVCHGSVGSNV